MNPTRRRRLSNADSVKSDVPLTAVVGSCILPLVFAPVDRIFRLIARVVPGLSYALVLGIAFMREHGSIVDFNEKEGFKPTPEAPWVPTHFSSIQSGGLDGTGFSRVQHTSRVSEWWTR